MNESHPLENWTTTSSFYPSKSPPIQVISPRKSLPLESLKT